MQNRSQGAAGVDGEFGLRIQHVEDGEDAASCDLVAVSRVGAQQGEQVTQCRIGIVGDQGVGGALKVCVGIVRFGGGDGACRAGVGRVVRCLDECEVGMK